MNISDMKWAFFSYGNNLGDFTRALETAKEMRDSGVQIKFFNHGGIHNKWITDAGIDSEDLVPELTWQQHEIIMDINRYKAKVGTPLPISKEEWIAMVESDLQAFDDYKPNGVYAGLNLSCMISVPYAKIPMVTQVPTVNCPAFIQKGLYNMPNTMERNFLTRYILPGFLKRSIMKRVLLSDSAKNSLISFNEARNYYGLKPIYNITELVRGDITLLPDLPILSGLPEKELTPGYYYTGPIFAKFDTPVNESIRKVFSRPGLNIFCSLGSSGFPEILKQVISILRKDDGFNVVCSTTTILNPEDLGKNTENFYACRFMPSHLVNEMADIAITHGGQGTIQTAVWAGTPVVGIGFQAEQQANIDGIALEGMAIRIPLYDVKQDKLLRAIRKVSTEGYRKNAERLKNIVRQTDGAKKSVEVMNNFLLGNLSTFTDS